MTSQRYIYVISNCLFADRPGLRNTEQIEQVQNKIMQGLQTLMGRNHPDETGTSTLPKLAFFTYSKSARLTR